MSTKKGRIGSPFDSYLAEQGTLEETNEVAAKRILALRDASRDGQSLREIMEEISRSAQERGLTPDVLATILDDRPRLRDRAIRRVE